MTARRDWSDFANAASDSFVSDLVPQAARVAPGELVFVDDYRKNERIAQCGGYDPLHTLLAYAQEELVYDASGNLVPVDDSVYASTPRKRRLNIFGLAYRRDARLQLHRNLADIVLDAAVILYNAHGWTMVLYDGLRTVEGAYNLYRFATDEDLDSGLLAMPGESAHNKGMAVDSMMLDRKGREVEMGGHFDHLDMVTNSRAYGGKKISDAAKMNRLIREAAFLRSAFSNNLLIAPLRSEFWDDRLPENREDLWRVLDSAARCLGIDLLADADVQLRKQDRGAFAEKWERWSYADFLARWKALFDGREHDLRHVLGTALPPLEEKAEFYHGNYHPIYDRELYLSGKYLTEAPDVS